MITSPLRSSSQSPSRRPPLRSVLVGWLVAAMVAVPALAAAHPPCAANPPCCVETVNPHGKTIPPAGLTTKPGTNPNSGQNDDGFYLVGTTDGKGGACGSGTSAVRLIDDGSLIDFGTFDSGTNVKYTQAPGGTPDEKKIGSDNGQAGAVEVHLTGTGDLLVCSVEDRTCVTCLVPPPPR